MVLLKMNILTARLKRIKLFPSDLTASQREKKKKKRKKHMLIYRHIKISNTQPSRIDNVWPTTPKYKACSEAGKENNEMK